MPTLGAKTPTQQIPAGVIRGLFQFFEPSFKVEMYYITDVIFLRYIDKLKSYI